MPILDQFGRPYAQAKKTPERRPLAAAPLYDAWRDYVSAGLKPETLAAIFREADAGDVRRQAELFDQMEEKDGHILGEISKRRNVILDVDFEVKPASDDPRDVRVADFVRDFLDGLPDWEDTLVSLQDGVGKGFSCLEIEWDTSEGQALPVNLEPIEQKRFLFTDPAGVLRRYPLLISDADMMGAEIPAWKAIFHRYGGKSGHPTRSGIYRVCAWMYLFKNYAIKDWVIFCEVYGMPLRLGKYSPGASEDDKDALVAAISSLGSDAAGIISKNTEIEFVENVKGKATGDLYEALAQFCNRENSKAILGQTLSAEVGDKGSYAAAKVHDGVRLDLLKADSRAAAGTVRSQLIRPIVGFNFGWDTALPKYEAPWEEEDDLKAKAEWMGSLIDRGVPVGVSHIYSEFGIPEPKQGEAVASGMNSGPFAAKRFWPGASMVTAKLTPEQNRVDRLADAATARADAALAALMAPIAELVRSAGSLEEIRDGIVAKYAEMDPADLEELVARAMFAAELYGRATVEEQVEGGARA